MAPPSNSQASIIWRKELSPQPWNAEIRCLRSAELDIRGLTDIISEEDRNDRDRCECQLVIIDVESDDVRCHTHFGQVTRLLVLYIGLEFCVLSFPFNLTTLSLQYSKKISSSQAAHYVYPLAIYVPNHTRHNDSVSRGGGSPTDRHFRAQRTIICEDLLSDELRHRLQTPENDPYRSESGLCVQVAISAALSNSPVDISAIALVCPRHLMPNGYNGILFGQSGCINSLVYTSIPRKILVKQGEEIGDSIWGDLVLRTYIDIFGDVHAF